MRRSALDEVFKRGVASGELRADPDVGQTLRLLIGPIFRRRIKMKERRRSSHR